MSSDRQRPPPPRERTFAELFPWRNIRRAMMLVLLIVAIVAIKRSTAPLLDRVGNLWGTPVSTFPPGPSAAGVGSPAGPGPSSDSSVRRIRLGPGLAPRPVAAPTP